MTLYVLRALVSLLLCRAQTSSLVSVREARAKLATVVHHTHFPTLTNATQQDITRSYTPNNTEEPDPTKQPDLPVRVHHFARYRLETPQRRHSVSWNSYRVRRSLPTTQLKARRIVHKHKRYDLTDAWLLVPIVVSANQTRHLWKLQRLRSASPSTFFSTAKLRGMLDRLGVAYCPVHESAFSTGGQREALFLGLLVLRIGEFHCCLANLERAASRSVRRDWLCRVPLTCVLIVLFPPTNSNSLLSSPFTCPCKPGIIALNLSPWWLRFPWGKLRKVRTLGHSGRHSRFINNHVLAFFQRPRNGCNLSRLIFNTVTQITRVEFRVTLLFLSAVN